jgi:hypothetical protein
VSELKVGARLRSQVCETEVIVVRLGDDSVELTCGGHPMLGLGADPAPGLTPADGLDGGSLLGKRYTAPETDIELLVTKAGKGTLANGSEPLVLKEAKPLPSSD